MNSFKQSFIVLAFAVSLTGASAQTNTTWSTTGNIGIGTTTPATSLQVVGPITAGLSGGSTLGIDYLYGNYSSGKLFVLGSQYSTAGSFLGYAVKAHSGTAGYLSSTGVNTGRSSIESNSGYVSLLTGATQTSTDGGGVSIAERMRIDAAGNVGIGTSTPGFKLEVNGDASIKAIGHAYFFINGNSGDSELYWQDNGASRWALGMHVGDNSENWNLYNYVTSAVNLSVNQTTGNVGIGTVSPLYKLSVKGTIRAQELIVDTGWSDYVFSKDYKLASLSDVERSIAREGHLPGIPSAIEVADKGISVGEMQKLLLGKIEELTLHQIEEEKRIARLEAENAQLKSQRFNP